MQKHESLESALKEAGRKTNDRIRTLEKRVESLEIKAAERLARLNALATRVDAIIHPEDY